MNSEKYEIIPAGSTVIESPGSRMVLEPDDYDPEWTREAEGVVVAEGGKWVLEGGGIRLKSRWVNAAAGLACAGACVGASSLGVPQILDGHTPIAGALFRGVLALGGVVSAANLSTLVGLPELCVKSEVTRRINPQAENGNLMDILRS
jgi:hypothetical protein